MADFRVSQALREVLSASSTPIVRVAFVAREVLKTDIAPLHAYLVCREVLRSQASVDANRNFLIAYP